jgi:hypothetical protein
MPSTCIKVVTIFATLALLAAPLAFAQEPTRQRVPPLTRLEDQFGRGERMQRVLLVVCRAGWGLSLDQDRCIQILDESGFLSSFPTSLVDLSQIPNGLNETEMASFLRKYAAEICFQA